jgi:hypothetical protein
VGIDEETLDKVRNFLGKKEVKIEDTPFGEPRKLSPEEQLRLEVEAFNEDPVLDKSVAARVDRYQERGAAWAMPHKVYCEKVGRNVYFMEYSVKGEERDECIEGNPFIPRCPFALQREGHEVCEHYRRFPFGRHKTVSIDTTKIKKKNK